MNLKKIKILIVEDDPVSGKAIKSLLQNNCDCTIDMALTATEALDLINYVAFEWKEKGYDIVLMDIGLPDLSGDSITEVIRKTEAQSVPIIAVTSDLSDDKRNIFFERGITDVIKKPATSRLLGEALEKYVLY